MKRDFQYFLILLSIFLFIYPFTPNFHISAGTANKDRNLSLNIENFSFTSVEGNEIQISDFVGKPIVIDWGATWCDICKNNQRSILEIYPSFQEKVHFISLSYGGSGDSIESYAKIKSDGGYPWLFGVDTDNYAKDVGLSTGTVWVLDSNLNLQKQWLYQLVSANDIASTINSALTPENIVTESFARNVQPTLLEDPFVLVFVLGIGLTIVAIGFGKIKSPKVSNPSVEIKKSDKKVDQKLEDLKHVVKSNPSSNSPQKAKRPRRR